MNDKKEPLAPPTSKAFRYVNGITTAWSRIVEDQAKSWNDIWSKMLSGNYDPKAFFTDTMKLWAKGIEDAATLATLPIDLIRYAQDSVPHVAFVIDSLAGAAPGKSVSLTTKLGDGDFARIAATPLRRVGSGAADISEKHVHFKGVDGSDCLEIDLRDLSGSTVVGEYTGLLFLNPPGAPGRPLVALTLVVVQAGVHKS